MKKRRKFSYLAAGIILFLSMSLLPQNVLAGGMDSVSVTLKDSSNRIISTANTAVATTIVIFNPDGNVNTGDGIQINFQSDFNIASVVNADVAVSQTHTSTDITKGTAAVSGQNLQIPITTESDTPSGQITVAISNSHITTPTTNATYKITITTWDLGDDNAFGGSGSNADTQEDEGSAAVVIGTNTVTISGTVDPSLSLTLSSNSCAFGTLSSSNIQTCNYDATISTNASNGYIAYIRDDGNLRNATNDINDVLDAEVTAGYEEYGVATSDSDYASLELDQYITKSNCEARDGGTTPVPAVGMDGTDYSFAKSTAAVSSDVTTLCHSVSISGTTPAGVYSQTITITVVGNF